MTKTQAIIDRLFKYADMNMTEIRIGQRDYKDVRNHMERHPRGEANIYPDFILIKKLKISA